MDCLDKTYKLLLGKNLRPHLIVTGYFSFYNHDHRLFEENDYGYRSLYRESLRDTVCKANTALSDRRPRHTCILYDNSFGLLVSLPNNLEINEYKIAFNEAWFASDWQSSHILYHDLQHMHESKFWETDKLKGIEEALAIPYPPFPHDGKASIINFG